MFYFMIYQWYDASDMNDNISMSYWTGYFAWIANYDLAWYGLLHHFD